MDWIKDGMRRVISMATYFEDMKKAPLQYPDLPCLVEKKPRKEGGVTENFYPLEVCAICDNQRVPLFKQTPEQMQNQIKVDQLPVP